MLRVCYGVSVEPPSLGMHAARFENNTFNEPRQAVGCWLTGLPSYQHHALDSWLPIDGAHLEWGPGSIIGSAS